MALKQFIACDITGKVLGDSATVCGEVCIQIAVPSTGPDKKQIRILAEHVDLELAELLYSTVSTHIQRAGLHLWKDGTVHTIPEVNNAVDQK